MAKDCEVKLDKKKIVEPLKIELNLGTEKIISELKSIQREAKKATQAIRELEFAQDDKDNTNEVLEMLDIASKYGFILTATSQEASRGIGKTHALVQKAIRDNMFILTNTHNQVKHIKDSFNFERVVNVLAYQYHSLPKNKYFLVDDMVSPEDLKNFMINTGKEVVSGFSIDKTTIEIGSIKLKNKEY